MFDFTAAPVPVRQDLANALRNVWSHLASPGTWWTGEQRIAIAAIARAAYGGGDFSPHPSLPVPAATAAAILSHEPAAVTPELIAQWQDDGLGAYPYVELIGVVAQLTMVDTFYRAVGLPLEPLPAPVPGDASRTVPDPPPTLTKAWVPMVGPPTIPTSLSAVPAEMAALEALHGPAYLTYEEMGDPAIVKGLTRAQIELVASRTSSINECFF